MHKLWAGFIPLVIFAVSPSSTNYTLKTYNIGSGGATSGSTNYGLQAGTGAQSGSTQSSANYKLNSDGRGVTDANVPAAPTVTNPSSYYDKLRVVINTSSNPTDTKYLIAVSTDSFATTSYIQTDNSLGASQAIANYQTYTAWGGASGFLLVGLAPSTTYQVKVKALQGKYTGSAFGPASSAATVATSVSFSVSTTLTATPPFAVAFSGLTSGVVSSGNADGVVALTTNANNGGSVYVRDSAGGLSSTQAVTTLASATADLSAVASGYGAQITAASQSSGGPLASVSPYNGSGNSVGVLSTALKPLLTTTAPVTGGSGTVRLKAKPAALTPSAPDYTDTVTLVAAMGF